MLDGQKNIRNLLDPASFDLGRKYKQLPPKVTMYDQYKYRNALLDKEIRILRFQTVEDTVANRHWCYWTDPVPHSYMGQLGATVIGTGLRFRCKKEPEAVDIINNFNKRINACDQSMEDAILIALDDNAIHAFSDWRILPIKEDPYIDLGRLEAANIVIETHQQYGWTKHIYRDYLHDDLPKNKKKFFATDWNPIYNYQTKEKADIGTLIDWHIPSTSLLTFKLVNKAPMSSALQCIIFKRWILWFMRKCAEKSWMPPVIGTIGNKDERFHMLGIDDFNTAMDDLGDRIAQLSSFGIMVKRYGEDIETLKSEGEVRGRETLVDQITLLNNEVKLAMGGAIGFDTDATEIGAARQVDRRSIRYTQSLRARLGNTLCRFYVDHLLPKHGINIKYIDLHPDFSHLREDRSLEVVQMVEAARVKPDISRKEARTILASVWDYIDPSDKEALAEIEKEVKEAQKQELAQKNTARDQINKRVQAGRPTSQKKGATQRRE